MGEVLLARCQGHHMGRERRPSTWKEAQEEGLREEVRMNASIRREREVLVLHVVGRGGSTFEF